MKSFIAPIVRSSRSQLADPAKMVRDLWTDLFDAFRIAWKMFLFNISAQYRETYLGYAWAFLPAIATTVIFVFLRNNNVMGVGEYQVPYVAFVMVGTILWQVFVDALSSPITMLARNKNLLSKINFPHEALILAGVGEVIFNFLVRLVLLVPVFLWYGIGLPWTAALAPFAVVALLLIGLVVGLILTPLSMLYQDISRGLAIFTSFLFFITPVVYMPPTEGTAGLLYRLNPVSSGIMVIRDWVLVGHTAYFYPFMAACSVILILMFLGWVFYKISIPHIIERMGS